MNNLICDLCGKKDLEFIYEPIGTLRNLKVFICKVCGLVQSFPKIDHVKTRNIAVSGGANWGNIRYGKGLRTIHDIDLINKYLDLGNIQKCLDIGSNRGKYYKELKKINSRVEYWGVEPDSQIMRDYPIITNDKIINDRIENVKLPKNYFDFIYCSHTVEHLKSPSVVLKRVYESLDFGGCVYIEVPNIRSLTSLDVIEEWFIDKHLYHFSHNLLLRYLKNLGFSVLYCSKEEDRENISLIAQKEVEIEKIYTSDYSLNKKLIIRYSNQIEINRIRVKKLAEHLNHLAEERRMVFWGAGRIFDILVNIGGIDKTKIYGLIDKHLPEYIEKSNDIELKRPSDILKINPDIVFICSRVFFKEIKHEILNQNSKIEILGFSQELGKIPYE